ncbi:uncharacterized protein G2W53_012066 [Senna tora]|uniref:Uncharacterized protein n=1 Tax=Senna tora TaxID=362788 RepID=A0A834TWF1_9FABA|nr:uncharacterized protein G2W53_012066 [Senna tora]
MDGGLEAKAKLTGASTEPCNAGKK